MSFHNHQATFLTHFDSVLEEQCNLFLTRGKPNYYEVKIYVHFHFTKLCWGN